MISVERAVGSCKKLSTVLLSLLGAFFLFLASSVLTTAKVKKRFKPIPMSAVPRKWLSSLSSRRRQTVNVPFTLTKSMRESLISVSISSGMRCGKLWEVVSSPQWRLFRVSWRQRFVLSPVFLFWMGKASSYFIPTCGSNLSPSRLFGLS